MTGSDRAKVRFGGVSEEAANRAEATVLLIRSGYRVYRPEADIDGEDLLVRLPHGMFVPTQLKPRVYVDGPRYSGLGLHILFPMGPFSPDKRRPWFLVPHDPLFAIVEKRHGGAPGWTGRWHNANPSKADPARSRAGGYDRQRNNFKLTHYPSEPLLDKRTHARA